MEPEPAADVAAPFDSSKPLKGIILRKTASLGGVFTADLTVEVTHLLVGDYDTAKYRHAAKSLAHVKAMDAGWVEALADLWRADAPIDFAAVETEWQLSPLETGGAEGSVLEYDSEELRRRRKRLTVCLTGFLNLEERTALQEKITAHGADYSGELNRRCTHLIVSKPEGQKYLAARKWGLKVVALEWLTHTVERGMVLDEKYYDPLLPPKSAAAGPGRPGHVSRQEAEAARFLCGAGGRPAQEAAQDGEHEAELSEGNRLGDILGGSAKAPVAEVGTPSGSGDAATPPAERTAPEAPVPAPAAAPAAPQPNPDAGIFSTSCFYIRGFDDRRSGILDQTITALGGRVCRTLDEVRRARAPYRPWHRFLLIPQDSSAIPDDLRAAADASAPPDAMKSDDTNDNNNKNNNDDDDNDNDNDAPSSAGFSGIDLHHLDRAAQQLGARFDETFRRATSLLLCRDLARVRREKLRLALSHGIPVVAERWLWECVSRGEKLPLGPFMFPELNQTDPAAQPAATGDEKQNKQQPQPQQSSSSTAKPAAAAPAPRASRTVGGFEADAFDDDEDEDTRPTNIRSAPDKSFTTTASARYLTARTHIFDDRDDFSAAAAAAPTIALLGSGGSSGSDRGGPFTPTVSDKEAEQPKQPSSQETARAQEEARAQARAQQLLAFSSKLTSLVAPSAGAGIQAPSSAGALPAQPTSPTRDRRRRGILGRATSTSSASSVSLAAAVAGGVGGGGGGGTTGAGAASTHGLTRRESSGSKARSVSVVDDDQEDSLGLGDGHSLLTQVEYDDPGAAEARAKILGRVASEAAPPSTTVSRGRRVRSR
ncbi:unnamed protein product [Parascedosporium putredinis]|uniref:BRCT domain-containing protein n=1 Tax=Parascedosporium putredinis TaxID=1442378 RepID=A0A9P1MF53_9PEZI|nr:unnamed protein product [Parascedosporium putredinis]CAI8002814.1 unnamed protein product [Parascedosporium putredinis]